MREHGHSRAKRQVVPRSCVERKVARRRSRRYRRAATLLRAANGWRELNHVPRSARHGSTNRVDCFCACSGLSAQIWTAKSSDSKIIGG
jgi:hypothetical protein